MSNYYKILNEAFFSKYLSEESQSILEFKRIFGEDAYYRLQKIKKCLSGWKKDITAWTNKWRRAETRREKDSVISEFNDFLSECENGESVKRDVSRRESKKSADIKESLNYRYLLEASQVVINFKQIFGVETFERFNSIKARLTPPSNDLSYWVSRYNTDGDIAIRELNAEMARADKRDIEGKKIPDPVNTKVKVAENDKYIVYYVDDYRDKIDLAMTKVDGFAGGYWCSAGRYNLSGTDTISKDDAVKVSQAKDFFSRYLNSDYLAYFVCMPKDGSCGKHCLCFTSSDECEDLNTWDKKNKCDDGFDKIPEFTYGDFHFKGFESVERDEDDFEYEEEAEPEELEWEDDRGVIHPGERPSAHLGNPVRYKIGNPTVAGNDWEWNSNTLEENLNIFAGKRFADGTEIISADVHSTVVDGMYIVHFVVPEIRNQYELEDGYHYEEVIPGDRYTVYVFFSDIGRGGPLFTSSGPNDLDGCYVPGYLDVGGAKGFARDAALHIREIKAQTRMRESLDYAYLLEASQPVIDFQEIFGNDTYTKFTKYKVRMESPKHDINHWNRMWKDAKGAVNKDNVIKELNDYLNYFETTPSNKQLVKEKKCAGAKLIYEDDEWKVYHITTYAAAVEYGKATTWCITGRYPGKEEEGQKIFDDYLEDYFTGYYYFISKKDDRKKYCVCPYKDKPGRYLVNTPLDNELWYVPLGPNPSNENQVPGGRKINELFPGLEMSTKPYIDKDNRKLRAKLKKQDIPEERVTEDEGDAENAETWVDEEPQVHEETWADEEPQVHEETWVDDRGRTHRCERPSAHLGNPIRYNIGNPTVAGNDWEWNSNTLEENLNIFAGKRFADGTEIDSANVHSTVVDGLYIVHFVVPETTYQYELDDGFLYNEVIPGGDRYTVYVFFSDIGRGGPLFTSSGPNDLDGCYVPGYLDVGGAKRFARDVALHIREIKAQTNHNR